MVAASSEISNGEHILESAVYRQSAKNDFFISSGTTKSRMIECELGPVPHLIYV